MTGGGQRSRIFFDALRRRGPVEVVALTGYAHVDVSSLFPESVAVHNLVSAKMPKEAPLLKRISIAATKFLFPMLWYRTEAKIAHYISNDIDLDRFDVVCCRHYQPFAFSGVQRGRARVLVDVDDFDGQTIVSRVRAVFGEWAAQSKVMTMLERRLTQVIVRGLEKADCVIFAAQQDVMEFDHPRSVLVPNVPFFEADRILQAPSASRDVVFVGSYQHLPNQEGLRWFLSNCWPEIHRRAPDTKFRIVGRGGWPNFEPLQRENPGVEVTGEVEDVAEAYANARVAISPINSGGGSKIKVVEGCAFARPVVCLPHSARGFDHRLVETLHVCDNSKTFVEAVLDLLQNDEIADTKGRAAKDVQQAKYSRRASEDRVLSALDEALSRPQRPLA
ncbi:MAG: glycosyltransferase family 4 protein [Pseudomonadota bacterium]